MISPFAPIQLPTLQKEQIKVEIGDESSDSRSHSELKRGKSESKFQKRTDSREFEENPDLYHSVRT